MENLILDEMSQEGTHDGVFDEWDAIFVKNTHLFGFIVMATHGTPSIGRVPCADALFVEHVTTRKSVRNRRVPIETDGTVGGMDVTRHE